MSERSWRAAVTLLAAACLATACLDSTRAQSLAPAATTAADQEEFVGPFPSWDNARTRHGAVGDGIADDTAALQRALDRLGDDDTSPVLYLPAGRYRLTATLRLDAAENVSIIGDDPATVTLVWEGPRQQPMFAVTGVAYSKVSRLTFDGRGVAYAAIEQSWDNRTGAFDTGNEYSDLRLTGVEFGIRGGFKGYGFAETAILRTVFDHNTGAGLALGNFNALDIWVWDSLFDHCTVGITNDPGAGNFHVYRSTFLGSAFADMAIQNTGGFSARGNYSEGSKAFFVSGRPINHPANVALHGNTVVDARDSVPIRVSNQGPALIVDNVIRSAPAAQVSPVFWKSPVGADVASVGNTFTVAARPDVNGRLVSVDDRTVAPAALTVPPRPPATVPLPNQHRQIFEVPVGADADRLQAVIDQARAVSGTRPVVHLPAGRYRLSRTVTLPPSDIQLVGDGYRSVLSWEGPGDGPVLHIAGPTQVTLRELRVDGGERADGIRATRLDQPSARVFLSSLEVRGGTASNLSLERVQTAAVDLVNFNHAYVPSGVSVRMVGGAATIHSGASAANYRSYDLSDGAALLARDIWFEGGAPDGFAVVHGTASMTLESSRVAPPSGGPVPAFRTDDLSGRFALINTLMDDRIVHAGRDATAEVLVLGVVREFHAMPFFTAAGPAGGRTTLANNRQRLAQQGPLSAGTQALADAGTDIVDAVRRGLTHTRSRILPPALTPASPGTTDLRFFRVWADRGRHNVHLAGE